MILTSIQSLMIFRDQTKSSDGIVALTCPHTPDLDVLGAQGGNVPQKWHFGGEDLTQRAVGVTNVDPVDQAEKIGCFHNLCS